MTREEAINVIKEHIDTYITCYGEEDTVAVSLDNVDIEAFDMAIKALEQEPCIQEKQAAVLNILFYKSDNNDEVKLSKELRDRIKNLPSVTPQQKTGHWILTSVEGNRVWHCRCSECDKDPQDYIDGSEDWWLIKNNLPKACPTCGAKMEVIE